MTNLLLLLGLFLVLFFLSRIVTKTISALLLVIFRNQKITIMLFSFLFLPGTIIHELAHYLMAKLLFVKTHGMSLTPRVEGNAVRLGSVAITRTDFVRRMLIGVAPFLVGSIIIFSLLYFTSEQQFPLLSLPMIFVFYIVFEIGNTMFSSKKDMEGVVLFLVISCILLTILFLLGIRIPDDFFTVLNSEFMKQLTEKGATLLLFPIILDVILVTILTGVKKVFS